MKRPLPFCCQDDLTGGNPAAGPGMLKVEAARDPVDVEQLVLYMRDDVRAKYLAARDGS